MTSACYRFVKALAWPCALLACWSVRAQQEDDRQRVRADSVSLAKPSKTSDLNGQNSMHVAASAIQIRQVLMKDAGILVELKRFVAKEASDNGQVVDDAALSDDAIFDRLEHDVEFRSVATRLVQRYGYLLPTINPDSEIAKQQDLVLKERARRLVQIEAQEDAQALQPKSSMGNEIQKVDQTNCNSKSEQNCDQEGSTNRGPRTNPRRREIEEEPDSSGLPGQAPTLSQILRASEGREETGSDAFSGSSRNLLLTSNPSRSPEDSLGFETGIGDSGTPGFDGMSKALRGDTMQNLTLLPGGIGASNDVIADKNTNSFDRVVREHRVPSPSGKDVESVAMVHRSNPYADIPSLYDMYVQASSHNQKLERFGLDVFRNGTREPDVIPMDLPVSPDYVVGPGDGLAIDLWGGVSQRIRRTVDREGRISLPEAGPVLVSGRTLADVQQTVQRTLQTQFRDISADVSLSRLRTVRVYVVGDVAEPGAYDISSLSTPLNALFAAGGVTSKGSLRALKHFRGNQLIEEVDAYDLLLHGVRGNPARLENGDTLLVPPLGPQVTIEGMVRRPAVYELRGESTLDDAIELAGGILPAAALQHVEVQRLDAHERHTMLTLDLGPDNTPEAVTKQFAAFKVKDGDQIHIFPIAPYNEKAIYLQGHVVRPGRYSYHEGMKLTDLIASYKDLLPEPSGRYAEIVRLNAPDYRPSVESFDLAKALENPAAAPVLQPLDTIRIFSRYDFELAPTIWVGGEVREPGTYRTSGQAHLRDAIYLAGGISPDAALGSAQLFRTQNDGGMKIMSVNLEGALAGSPSENLLLEPRDRILVHRNGAAVDPPTVYIKGEVAKPGRYPLTTNMHIEDLVRAAGGLKRSADPEKADLTRYVDSGTPQSTAGENLPVELASAMNGGTNENVALRDGDVLTIRQIPGWGDIGASVAVRGEVEHPGAYGIRPGERLSSVLARAGGFSAQAFPYGAVLMRKEVRELEMKAHTELIERVKFEQLSLKALPEGDPDQRNAKLSAIAQTETTLTQLQTTAPIGRVVIHVQPNLKEWRNTAADVPLRDGDVLVIPKRADYVMVTGQVYNPTAVSYHPGRSAKWYLSQSGGLTALADKKSVFVIRADGSVVAAKNNNDGWFAGDPLNTVLRPGDSIVVPEKAPKIGGRNWAMLIQSAQVASSLALAVAYIHP